MKADIWMQVPLLTLIRQIGEVSIINDSKPLVERAKRSFGAIKAAFIGCFFYLIKNSYLKIWIIEKNYLPLYRNLNQMSFPLIKLHKKTTGKIEQIKVVLKVYCLFNDIKMSDSELTVLAYCIVYGIKQETFDLIINSKIFTENSLQNTLSKLRTNKFILRNEKNEDILSDNFKIPSESIIGILIKIENN